jgi:choline dehydrogenase
MTESSDFERMRFGLRTCAELAGHSAFTEITTAGSISLADDVLDDDNKLDAHIAESLNTAFHGMGTCRIGESSDSLSVVDDQCRVHGLDGLRVVDASIAPAVTRGNAHATVLMIAEHAATLIRGEAA